MQVYKVGGAVRDRLLGRPVTEVDWVVVGASAEQMLARGFRPVGADFPVFLHPQTGEEYALARTERKSGRGYGGFTFHAAPDVTLEQDLLRRDLTINALAEDDHGRVIDPYGGQQDLTARRLRHVSPAFAEDPLRVLRVARFAARYWGLGFRVAEETLALMRQLADSGELQALTPERCWKEISRALMEPHPEIFIQTLHDCAALAELLPELEGLYEGDGEPTELLHVLQQCARDEQPLSIRWACLLRPPSDDAEGRTVQSVTRVNQRFKVPRECAELAVLVGQYQGLARRALDLTAEALLDLLQHFDIYRRPERFEQFLAACETIARAQTGQEGAPYPQATYLRGAAASARAVGVQPLLAQGFQGAALGEALRHARQQALESYRAKQLLDANRPA